MGQDKQEDFQLKARGGDRMNCFVQYSLDQAADGCDHLAIVVLHRGKIWRNGSLRILLPNRTPVDIARVEQCPEGASVRTPGSPRSGGETRSSLTVTVGDIEQLCKGEEDGINH